MKSQESSSWESRNLKLPNPHQYLSMFKKTINTKSKLLKQLEQLNIDITDLQALSLNELIQKCDHVFKNSYSFKYIGVKDNQIGILSKRLKPNSLTTDILPDIENKFLVTEFFFPKPLKTIIKHQEKQPVDSNQNVIRFVNPNIPKKQRSRNSKVRGGWINLKHKLKNHEHHRPLIESNLLEPKVHNNSYSRTLQQLHKKGLQISPGKTFYNTLSSSPM